MYKLDHNADLVGTSFTEVVLKATPRKLLEVFGQPTDEDIDGKVQMEWTFSSSSGQIFSLYDWKEGELNPDMEVNFHIGSTEKSEDKVTDFKRWLEGQL